MSVSTFKEMIDGLHTFELKNKRTMSDEKTIAETKELVDSFMFAGIYFTDGDNGANRAAINCAKIHCELMIESFEKIGWVTLYPAIQYYKEIKLAVESL